MQKLIKEAQKLTACNSMWLATAFFQGQPKGPPLEPAKSSEVEDTSIMDSETMLDLRIRLRPAARRRRKAQPQWKAKRCYNCEKSGHEPANVKPTRGKQNDDTLVFI